MDLNQCKYYQRRCHHEISVLRCTLPSEGEEHGEQTITRLVKKALKYISKEKRTSIIQQSEEEPRGQMGKQT